MGAKAKRRAYLYLFLSITILFILYCLINIEGYSEASTGIKLDKYIKRKNTDNTPQEISGVPLVIYRTWANDILPMRMKEIIDRSIGLTPEFDNYLYTDEDCYNFIKDNFEPNVLNAYRCLKPGAYKADLWRYCILYKNGGVYIDMKLELMTSFTEMIQSNREIFVWDKLAPDSFAVWNGFLATPPSNPIFKECIDEIVENCKNRNYRRSPLDVTGPNLLGRILMAYKGDEFIKASPFKHDVKGMIRYNDIVIFKEYDGYREDQKRTTIANVKYYADLWHEGDIFDTTIDFL